MRMLSVPILLAAGALFSGPGLSADLGSPTAPTAAQGAAFQKKPAAKSKAAKSARVRAAKSGRHVRVAMKQLRAARKHTARAKALPQAQRSEAKSAIDSAMARLRAPTTGVPPKKAAPQKKK